MHLECLCYNATTSPTRWMGTRASPVNGVANGGKMDTKKKGDVGYPGAYQEQGRDAQEDKKQRTYERRVKLLAR